MDEKKLKRGKILTAYLVIMITITVVNIFLGLSGKCQQFVFYKNYPNWIPYWFTAIEIIGLFFYIGIWQMKKWGVFGSIFLIVIGNAVILFFRHDQTAIISSIIGIIIFALVIWKPYKRMT